MFGNDSEKHVKDLYRFLRCGVNSCVTGLYFSCLRRRYPLHYLHYMEELHEIIPEGFRGEAIGGVNKLYMELKTFLITPPETEEEIKRFHEVQFSLQLWLQQCNKLN